jgi:DNA-binding transcriptional LysR family regulator
MELYQLRTLVTVADSRSVTRAAERLFTTPSSVSAHIKALETELDVVLFDRTSRGMSLTPTGERLRQRAEQVLRAAEALAEEAATLREHLHGEVRVGLNAAPSLLRVRDLIAAVREAQPGLRFRLMASTTGHIVKQLGSRALDAGFVFGPVPSDELAAVSLGEVQLVVATPGAWASELSQPPRWDELAERPWIGSTVDCPFEAIGDRLFARHGRIPPKVVMTDDGPTKVDLIRAGTGAALLEESEAEEAAAQGGIALWSPGGLRCPLHFAWPATRDGDAAVTAVRHVVMRLWHCAPADGIRDLGALPSPTVRIP